MTWIWYVPTDQVENLKKVPGLTVTSGETMRVGYIYFDAAGRSGEIALKDVRVRQAIAHAINRTQFTKTFFASTARARGALLPDAVRLLSGRHAVRFQPARRRS